MAQVYVSFPARARYEKAWQRLNRVDKKKDSIVAPVDDIIKSRM